MRRRQTILCAIVALLLGSLSAATSVAQTPDANFSARVGLQLAMSDGRTVSVTAVNGFEVTLRDDKGGTFVSAGFLDGIGSSNSAWNAQLKDVPASLYPLAVGRRTMRRVRIAEDAERDVTHEVISTDVVTVDGRPYPCWSVKETNKSTKPPRYGPKTGYDVDRIFCIAPGIGPLRARAVVRLGIVMPGVWTVTAIR
jgi:hypothetical protein